MHLSFERKMNKGKLAVQCAGLLIFALAALSATAAESQFAFKSVGDKSLGLWEGQRPVLVYNHGIMSKTGAPASFNRSTYIHPLYGLDGEMLTDDFPKDHYHHRGLFWAWPHVKVAGKNYDLWTVKGIYQRFERWLARNAGAERAILGVENGWFIGEKKVVQERAWFQVLPSNAEGQFIDCEFEWVPLGQAVTLAGAEEKSYGGLTLRFAPRTNTVITTPLGTSAKDLPMTRLAWADLSAQFPGVPQKSGVAIFIAPDHPDYPPEWLTRHYGVLCVGWPGVRPATFMEGEKIRARYRVWIHRGVPDQATVKKHYDSFAATKKIDWPTSPAKATEADGGTK